MIFKSIRTYVNTDERRYLVYSNIDRMGRYVTACVDTETDETVKKYVWQTINRMAFDHHQVCRLLEGDFDTIEQHRKEN